MPSLKDQLTNYAYSPSANYSGYAPAISYFDTFNNMPQSGPPTASRPPIVNETLRDNLVNRGREEDSGDGDLGMGLDPGIEPGFNDLSAFGGMPQSVSNALGMIGSIGLGFAPGIGPAVSALGALSNIGHMTGLFDAPSPSNMISQGLQAMFGPEAGFGPEGWGGFSPSPNPDIPDPYDPDMFGPSNIGVEDITNELGFEGFGPSAEPEEPDFDPDSFGPSSIGVEDISDVSGPSEEEEAGTGEEGEGEGEGDGSDDDGDDDGDGEGEGGGEGDE